MSRRLMRENHLRLVALSLVLAIWIAPRAASTQDEPDNRDDKRPAAKKLVSDKLNKRSPKIRKAVAKAVRKVRKIGGKIGIAIADVETGDLLAAHREHRAFNPASNAKIITAAAALSQLRPSYKYATVLYGRRKGSHLRHLVIRGSGDPSLHTEDLWRLAHELKKSGVRRIDGDILVDQRFFDGKNTPPAYDQQPNEWAAFRAPVSSLALNGNTITLLVRPTRAGKNARVVFEPPGFVESSGHIRTLKKGASQRLRWTLMPLEDRLASKIGGGVPEKSRQLEFTRRVADPTLLAGYAMKSLLEEMGIRVRGKVRKGARSKKDRTLAVHRSQVLSTLLYRMGKKSDNFYAEMVFKSLGLEHKGRPAHFADAASAVKGYLEEIGAWEEGDVVKNGSGLFDANRTTPATFVKLLTAAHRDPRYRNEFISQLSIAGADGTMRRRIRKYGKKRCIRAKTGTLESVASLSGYVLAPHGKHTIAFSLLVNKVPGKVGEARHIMDRVVRAIADELWE